MRRMGNPCLADPAETRRRYRTPRHRALAVVLGLTALGAMVGLPQHSARAQIERPVYVDDSPRAAEGLGRAQELAAIGNLDEAVRVLQRMLEEEGQRVLPLDEEPLLYIPVRRHVHRILLDDPDLLARYRTLIEPRAAELVEAGEIELVERTMLLTTSGFESTLRLAQRRLEAAMFEAAHLTLLELEEHPDRRDQRRIESAQLMTLIASYVGAEASDRVAQLVRDDAARDVARWRQQAGLDPGPPVDVEMPRFRPSHDPLERGEVTDLEGLVQGPPWSSWLGRSPIIQQAENRGRTRSSRPPNQRHLYSMPTTWGDIVFTTNGKTITAWNRFTLEEIWQKEEPREFSRPIANNQQRVSEPAMLAVGRGLVVGLSGLNYHNNRSQPLRRLFARDAQTGEILWTVQIGQVIPDRAGSATFAGPPIIDQGAVIVGIDRDDQQRRLDGAMLAAFDLRDGSTRWVRTLGSSGSINFQSSSGGLHAIQPAGGILYSAHRLGFMYAVESATGRIRWIRRDRSVTIASNRQIDEPWALCLPVLRGDVAYTLSPDRQTIYKLARRDGSIVSEMPSTQLDSPSYLLSAGGMLVGVSRNNIYSVAFSDFGPNASGRSVGSLEGKSIRGRVVSTGELLMAPTQDSLRIFTPDHESLLPIEEIALERTGNILPLASELLVVDDREVHAYLVWDIAQRMLSERLEQDPDDPSTPITFAELAFRAGKFELVVELIDAALVRVERAPLALASERALERMFDVLRNMFEGQAQYASVARPSLPLRGEILLRLGRCATSTPQRATFLLLRSEHFRETGEYARAVEQLQSILDAPELAQASIDAMSVSLPAQREATSRLRALIREHGAELYEPYQAEALRRLESLAEELDPEAFESIARRYPASSAAARALTEAAVRHGRQGNQRLARQALEEASDTARAAGLAADDPLMGEIAGRLVLLYLGAGRHQRAETYLEQIAIESPDLVLTEMGVPIDLAQISAQIEEAARTRARRPRIGAHAIASEELVGWFIDQGPAFNVQNTVTDRIMLRSEENFDTQAMWVVGQDGQLAQRWSITQPDEVFLWIDRHGVFMMREVGQDDRADPIIILRDANTGDIRWQAGPFRSLVERHPVDDLLSRPGGVVPRIDLPNPGPTGERPPITKVRGEFDDQTLVLADHAGRLVAIDLEAGDVLWTKSGLVQRLHDLDVSQGALLIGGSSRAIEFDDRGAARGDPADDEEGVVVALDARSGKLIATPQRTQGGVRWVRVAQESMAVYATRDSIATFGLYLDRDGWSSTHESLRETTEAWTVGSRLILRREQGGDLVQIRAEGGPDIRTLDTSELLTDRFGDLGIDLLGESALIQTSNGLGLFDLDGQLIGRDAREQLPDLRGRAGRVLLVGLSERYVPTLTRVSRVEPGQLNRYELTFFTASSLRAAGRVELEAGAEPNSMVILDGHVLISSGSITTVIEVPPEDGDP